MNEHAQEVYLVRHGETSWSLSGQHTGSTDIPLTENGEKARASWARSSRAASFGGVLASPLSRARRDRPGWPASSTAQSSTTCSEWDYGEYEGMTTAEIRETAPDWILWRDGCPGGESPDQIGARADSVVATCATSTATCSCSRTATSCA